MPRYIQFESASPSKKEVGFHTPSVSKHPAGKVGTPYVIHCRNPVHTAFVNGFFSEPYGLERLEKESTHPPAHTGTSTYN